MRFSFPYSHAFHGSRVAVEVGRRATTNCTVEFGDGSVVIGECRQTDERAFLLSVPRYVTAKGTEMAPKQWRIVNVVSDVWRAERTAE